MSLNFEIFTSTEKILNKTHKEIKEYYHTFMLYQKIKLKEVRLRHLYYIHISIFSCQTTDFSYQVKILRMHHSIPSYNSPQIGPPGYGSHQETIDLINVR